MISIAKPFILLLCLFLASCAAAPSVITDEVSVPVKKEHGTEEPDEDTKNGIWVSLTADGNLQSSPHLLSDVLKMIPKFSKVLVLGYEESVSHQDYLKVEYDEDTGYLSTIYLDIDSELKQFIESEKQKIYERNLQTLKVIENNQREIESEKAWVKPILADVRSSYSAYSAIKDNLERGGVVFIQEEKDGWYRILYNGPIIDYEPSTDTDTSYIVNTYGNIHNLLSAYTEGWIQTNFVSDEEIEKLSDDEKRRSFYINENPDIHQILKDAILNGEIIIGMSMYMVIASWGSPDEIDRSNSVFSPHEEWIYGDTYLYFENGILRAWQNFDE